MRENWLVTKRWLYEISLYFLFKLLNSEQRVLNSRSQELSNVAANVAILSRISLHLSSNVSYLVLVVVRYVSDPRFPGLVEQ